MGELTTEEALRLPSGSMPVNIRDSYFSDGGSGKTATLCAFVASLLHQKKAKRILVLMFNVCRSSCPAPELVQCNVLALEPQIASKAGSGGEIEIMTFSIFDSFKFGKTIAAKMSEYKEGDCYTIAPVLLRV
ncbi:unnamed protein product [Rhizophagus irregularis]|uniref:Uncharacterized protein n=1 Tax=Rhizophagus irregularis TaxID=588596 RepID=A0A916EFB3_9GLOM|nr:unnamed protein product [Rhizophagus irregularis]